MPNPVEDRQARLAKMQAAQKNAERRRSFLVIGIAALLALVLVGVVVTVIVQSESERSAIEEQAAALGHALGRLIADGRSTKVWSSPYIRALQTAQLSLEVAGGGLALA